MTESNTRYRDFTSTALTPVVFDLDGDRFYCAPKLPIPMLKKVGQFKNVTAEDAVESGKIETLLDLLNDILLDESVELFNKRVNDKNKPISINEISEIVSWLLEVYGERPTQQSKGSVDGSSTNVITNGGISSTGGAPVVELIPTSLVQTVS